MFNISICKEEKIIEKISFNNKNVILTNMCKTINKILYTSHKKENKKYEKNGKGIKNLTKCIHFLTFKKHALININTIRFVCYHFYIYLFFYTFYFFTFFPFDFSTLHTITNRYHFIVHLLKYECNTSNNSNKNNIK